jgi:lipopolysaccharide transport system ATP-binding protein
MANDLAIRVEGLGKRYAIGERRAAYRTLRESIAGLVAAPGRLFGGARARRETIWALKGVDLEVRRGEVLGVIGRNGAGKTTLLKILSRITEPTEGRVELHGRVGSLLEVGTGFHPELTGRENIFLNGAILGMRRAEIQRKFDEIVGFAEVERFLDTPVKHYSSGMYVRLAFAVAAHLEPEILLVDEVLAVGDAAFQKKCLGKMASVAQAGRTVVFVSHDLGAVSSLTSSCILLDEGAPAADGPTPSVVREYLAGIIALRAERGNDLEQFRRDRGGNRGALLTGVTVNGMDGAVPTIRLGGALMIDLQVHARRELCDANFTIILKNAHGQRVATLFSLDQGFALSSRSGVTRVRARLDTIDLSPGQYFADIGINESIKSRALDVLLDVPLVRVADPEGALPWADRPWGAVHWQGVSWSSDAGLSESEA